MSEAEKQARQFYERFKALHPNSSEEFEFSIENAKRWRWHIEQAEKKAPTQEFNRGENVAEAAAEASERAFLTFEEMPEYMKTQFSLIASHFPGQQIYATGSRVDGSYMEEWSPEEVRLLREKLGKKTNKGSDYDIVLEPGQEEAARKVQLPKGADLLRYSPGGKKIAIPMWDFSKLPESEHARVIETLPAWLLGLAYENSQRVQTLSNHFLLQ